jgi:RNA polymerase sigma-70 factor (ECF subfamily)
MATLQARLAAGNQTAFVELYDTYASRVRHYLLVRVGFADADDVLQETFVRLARARHKLAKADDLEAYVITVARNEAARTIARNARRRAKQRPLEGTELFCCRPGDTDAREAAETVAAALGQLTDELREIVELKTYVGLTFQQIAKVTGLPQGTAATRYRTALAKMQSWIQKRQ